MNVINSSASQLYNRVKMGFSVRMRSRDVAISQNEVKGRGRQSVCWWSVII
jgi:hypothetical protein